MGEISNGYGFRLGGSWAHSVTPDALVMLECRIKRSLDAPCFEHTELT